MNTIPKSYEKAINLGEKITTLLLKEDATWTQSLGALAFCLSNIIKETKKKQPSFKEEEFIEKLVLAIKS